jgi:hypothetical protein
VPILEPQGIFFQWDFLVCLANRRIAYAVEPLAARVEDNIRQQLGEGHGILKIAKLLGVGSGTVQRVKREMAVTVASAASVVLPLKRA